MDTTSDERYAQLKNELTELKKQFGHVLYREAVTDAEWAFRDYYLFATKAGRPIMQAYIPVLEQLLEKFANECQFANEQKSDSTCTGIPVQEQTR